MAFTIAEQSAGRRLSSLNRSLDVLEAFSLDQTDWELGHLSRHLGLAKPTLHRILENLKLRGYIRQDPETRRYRLGLRAWEVGAIAMGGFDLLRSARPVLQELTETTGEQATLWLYDDGDAVCVERAEGSQRVRSHTRIGTREPAHLLATGRCLLTYVGDAELDEVLGAIEAAGGPFTASRVREMLRDIHERGFDVSRGDRWPDVFAVGAPICDYTGGAVAAMGVSGPATRFDDDTVSTLGEQLREATRNLSRQLGFAAAENPAGLVSVRHHHEGR